MRKVFISLCISMVSVLIFGVSAYAAEADDLSDVKAYCKEYGISMSNDPEFIASVRNEIDAENAISVRSSSPSRPGAFTKIVRASEIGDIIWTNNPLTPFNHVGIYTKKNQITEALENGVRTRSTGKQREFPYEIYKVVTKDYGSARYPLAKRQQAASWALKQVKKPYDPVWWNNKLNTSAGNAKFNCSELVWKSWRFGAGVDLDVNGGKGVYPNDIKKSKRTVLVAKG